MDNFNRFKQLSKEMVNLLTLCGLMILVGAFKACMDVLRFRFTKSVFRRWPLFFDPQFSATNKYKDHDPDEGPKFPLSTTVLVWTTDGWHLFQMLFLSSLFAAIVVSNQKCDEWNEYLALFAFLRLIFGGSFTLFYEYFLIRK